MYRVIVEIVYILMTLYQLPSILYHLFCKRLYNERIISTLLRRNFPTIHKNNKKLLWIHAVSVGEIIAVASLVKKIRQEYPHVYILFTYETVTGQKEANRSIIDADCKTFLPMDFSYNIGPIIKKLKPDVIISTESTLIYNFITYSKEQGAKIIHVNGFINQNILKILSILYPLTKKLLSQYDLMCFQNKDHQRRYQMFSIPKEKCLVTGNLKFDFSMPKLSMSERNEFKEYLHIHQNEEVLVFGSTHELEENEIAKIVFEIHQVIPDLKTIIAPRNVESSDKLSSYFKKLALPHAKYSDQNDIQYAKVIIIDLMGQLINAYQIANLAVIGGSFHSKYFGHNILEPIYFDIPVIFGPFMSAQLDLVEVVLKYKAGLQVELENVKNVVVEYLKDKNLQREMYSNCHNLLKNIGGETEQTFLAIKKILNEKLNP